MKPRTSWRDGCRLLLLTLCIAHSDALSAQTVGPLVGRWDNVSIALPNSGNSCRYIEIVTRAYDLAAGMNHSVQGAYTRTLDRRWFSMPAQDCVLPGQHAQPYGMTRIDSWFVQGQPIAPDKQSITANLTGCIGDCGDQMNLTDKFDITLTREGSKVYELDPAAAGPAGTNAFRSATDRESDEQGAAGSFRQLLQPLLNGDCNEFFSNSLDPGIQASVKQDLFCSYGRDLAAALPTIIRDNPMMQFAPTASLIYGLTRQLLIGDGDVLVQRYLVLNAAGQGIPLAAVLRKQNDGTWRVLDIVP